MSIESLASRPEYDFLHPSQRSPKSEALRALCDRLAGCRRCPALTASASHPILGEGPADARTILIGEAPGAAEDVCARPFVGPSGAELRSTLLRGVEHLVFITNTIRCRPENNREPSRTEADFCYEWLLQLLGLLQPRLIIAAGRVAQAAVLPFAITTGKWQAVDVIDNRLRAYTDISTMSFYVHHPAYLLRLGGQHTQSVKVQQILDTYGEARELIQRVASEQQWTEDHRG